MSEYINQINPDKMHKAFMKLADDLAELDADTSSTLMVDNDMLSLVVSEVLKGVDISDRYPAFYRKILNNNDLRQAFTDALGSMENEMQSAPAALPFPAKPALAFLSQKLPQPIITKLGADKWRTIWQQSIEQLQAIFSPSELAFRSDPSLFEDPWITLVRGDIEVAGSQYAVVLECSPAVETDDALAVSFNLAVTLEAPIDLPQTPLEATLQWGSYDNTIIVSEEGRSRFPDIPLTVILDAEQQNVNADLSLILEKNT